MRFTKAFNYESLKSYISDFYEIIFYNWSEYDPVVCDPNDEKRLKELNNQLLEKLEEVSNIIEQMGAINKDSFGC